MVFGLNLKDDLVLCVVVTYQVLFLAKNRHSAMMAMVPLLYIMVHSQVAALLPVGDARAMHSNIMGTYRRLEE